MAQSSFCQVDQAEKLFFFFLELCVESQLRMSLRPPWECCVLEETIGTGRIFWFEAAAPPRHVSFLTPSEAFKAFWVFCTPVFAGKEVCEYPPILWLTGLFSGEHLWLCSPRPTFFFCVCVYFFLNLPEVLFPIVSLGLVSMYSVTGWSRCPVCFRARSRKDRAAPAPASRKRRAVKDRRR